MVTGRATERGQTDPRVPWHRHTRSTKPTWLLRRSARVCSGRDPLLVQDSTVLVPGTVQVLVVHVAPTPHANRPLFYASFHPWWYDPPAARLLLLLLLF